MGNDLAGLRVLVTRPAHRAGPLMEKLAAAGAVPLLFPLLEIRPAAGPELAALRTRLADYDLVIFISPTAVKFAAAALQDGWPETLPLAAVGPGTAREIHRQFGRDDVLVPATGSGSEALLAAPALQQLAGQRVLLVRGAGGRDVLERELTARGATVDHAVVYHRQRPAEAGPLNTALREQALDLILIHSSEALDNLLALTEPDLHAALREVPLLLSHPRQTERARALGLRQAPILAHEGSDAAIIDAIHRLRAPA